MDDENTYQLLGIQKYISGDGFYDKYKLIYTFMGNAMFSEPSCHQPKQHVVRCIPTPYQWQLYAYNPTMSNQLQNSFPQ